MTIVHELVEIVEIRAFCMNLGLHYFNWKYFRTNVTGLLKVGK